MSIERTVAVLTPFFAAVAGALAAWLGKHFPGLPALNKTDVTVLMSGGALSGTAAALKWLHGRARYVEIAGATGQVTAELDTLKAHVAANPTAGPALADIETLLRAHETQVETVIDEHVPAAVGQALKLLFAQLGGGMLADPPPASAAAAPATPAPAAAVTIDEPPAAAAPAAA